jgi:hypothetical protein
LLQTSSDETTRAAAASRAFYYLGRLDGREPSLDLEKLITDESHHLLPSEIRAVSQQCADTLAVRGRVMTEIGRQMLK